MNKMINPAQNEKRIVTMLGINLKSAEISLSKADYDKILYKVR